MSQNCPKVGLYHRSFISKTTTAQSTVIKLSSKLHDTNNEAHLKECRRKSVYTRKDSFTDKRNQNSNRPLTAPSTHRSETGPLRKQSCCSCEQFLKNNGRNEGVVVNNQKSTDKWKEYVKMVYKTTEKEQSSFDGNYDDTPIVFKTKTIKDKTGASSNDHKIAGKNLKSVVSLGGKENSLRPIDLEFRGSYFDEGSQEKQKSNEMEKNIKNSYSGTNTNSIISTAERVATLNIDVKDPMHYNPDACYDEVEEFKEEEFKEINVGVKRSGKVGKLYTLFTNKSLAISDLLSDTDGSDDEGKGKKEEDLEIQNILENSDIMKPMEIKDSAKERVYYPTAQQKNYKFTPVIIPLELSSKQSLSKNDSNSSSSNQEKLDVVIDNLLSETHLVTTRETPFVKKSKSININNELDNLLNELQT